MTIKITTEYYAALGKAAKKFKKTEGHLVSSDWVDGFDAGYEAAFTQMTPQVKPFPECFKDCLLVQYLETDCQHFCPHKFDERGKAA